MQAPLGRPPLHLEQHRALLAGVGDSRMHCHKQLGARLTMQGFSRDAEQGGTTEVRSGHGGDLGGDYQ